MTETTSYYKKVASVTVTDGGSGYTSAPTVTISGNATATATVSGGKVTAITLTSAGYNYLSPPTITFSGGSGSGAAATANMVYIDDAYNGFKESLSHLIANQLPDFVRVEYPVFVTFLEKYYEFLDEENQVNNFLLNYEKNFDINRTLDTFLPKFKNQYAQNFPLTAQIDDRRLIKFIKQFYEAKGSEKAIELLFRILYNERTEIFYPSEQVLRASDGIWIEDITLKLAVDTSITANPFDLSSKTAKITYYENISSVTYERTVETSISNVTKFAYVSPAVYELVTNLPKTATIRVPGAGASANALVSGGQVKAIVGETSKTFSSITTAGTLVATVATSGAAGQFTCGNSTLSIGDRLTITGTPGVATLAATVAVSGTAGQFTCGASTLAVNDRVRITGTKGGTATITGYTTGTTYRVSAVTGTSPSVTGFTLTTESGTAIVTTAGTLTGLTYTTTGTITGYTTGTTYKVSAVTGTSPNVTGFTLTTQSGVPLVTTAGKLTGLTYATATGINLTSNTITVPSHGYSTGDVVIYDKNGGTIITGLTNYAVYFVIVVDVNTIKLATSAGNATLGTAVDLTIVGSGSQLLYAPVIDTGNGYFATPAVQFTSATGTSATARAILADTGEISHVIVINGGSGYSTAPAVTFSTEAVRTKVEIVSGTTTTLYGYIVRQLSTVEVIDCSGTPPCGFSVGDIYSIDESGSVGSYTVEFNSATTGTLAATVATSGTAGQFTCGASTLAVNDRITITGTRAGSGTITGYTTGTVYRVSAVTGTSPNVTGFTLTTEASVAIVTTAGTLTGLTYTTSTPSSSGYFLNKYNETDTTLNPYTLVGRDNKASIRIDAIDVDGCPTAVSIFDTGFDFERGTFTVDIESALGCTATLSFTTGAVNVKTGRFRDSRGMLSNVNKLQDNFYYQNYSYVVRSNVPSNKWLDIVKNTAHPAGTAIFGELTIEQTVDFNQFITTPIQPLHIYEFVLEELTASGGITRNNEFYFEVEFIKILADSATVADANSSHVYKVLSDFVTTSETLDFDFDIGIYGNEDDTTETLDVFDRVVQYVREVNETTITAENAITNFGKVLEETIFLQDPYAEDFFDENYVSADTTEFDFAKVLADAANTTESQAFVLSKPLTDTTTNADTFARTVEYYRTFTESVISNEYANAGIEKPQADVATAAETSTNHLYKSLTDSVTSTDTVGVIPYLVKTDNAGATELLIVANDAETIDSIAAAEQSLITVLKGIFETVAVTEDGIINVQNYIEGDFGSDYVGQSMTFAGTNSSFPVPNSILNLDADNSLSYAGTGTTWFDMTANDLDASLTNMSYTDPYFTLNGTNSTASIADNALLEPGTGDFTLEAWVYYSTIAGSQRTFISKTNNGGGAADWSYGLRTNSAGATYIEVGNGTTSVTSPSYTVSTGQWYHIVGVWTNVASNSIALYINGVSQGSNSHSFTSVKNSTNPLYLGSYNGGEYSQWFDGKISAVRYYNKALTAEEVTQNFTALRGRFDI